MLSLSIFAFWLFSSPQILLFFKTCFLDFRSLPIPLTYFVHNPVWHLASAITSIYCILIFPFLPFIFIWVPLSPYLCSLVTLDYNFDLHFFSHLTALYYFLWCHGNLEENNSVLFLTRNLYRLAYFPPSPRSTSRRLGDTYKQWAMAKHWTVHI